MKTGIISLLAGFALVLSASAADVTISDVHVCCKKCVTGAEKAVGSVDGAKAVVSQDDGTVKISAPDKATLQKATDALIAAGYFGTSSDAGIKVDASTGAGDKQVKAMTITGLHLCCNSCVKAVDKAVKTVPGVTGQTAAKGAKSFEVTGDFNEKAVLDALQKAGLTGKVSE